MKDLAEYMLSIKSIRVAGLRHRLRDKMTFRYGPRSADVWGQVMQITSLKTENGVLKILATSRGERGHDVMLEVPIDDLSALFAALKDQKELAKEVALAKEHRDAHDAQKARKNGATPPGPTA